MTAGPLTLEDMERLIAEQNANWRATGERPDGDEILALWAALRSVMTERDALRACLAGDHDPEEPDYSEEHRPVFRQTVSCKRCGKEVPCG